MRKLRFPYKGREILLSVQHLFAMFGATVLVPLLTKMDTSVALFTAGIGTLLFHMVTKRKVPVFLGSSFAFIVGLQAIIGSDPATIPSNIPYAQGAIIVAGLLYLALALIVYFVGVDRIKRFLPPVVTGPVIIVIAMGLSPVALGDAFYVGGQGGAFSWQYMLIALFTFAVVVIGMVFAKGFFKIVPILIGIASGYLLCVILNLCGVFEMNYEPIINAAWFNLPYVTTMPNGGTFLSLPKFGLTAILTIAPIALVTFMEHIGDITTNGMVVGKDFLRDPGLHRTLLGDGIATAVAGFFGGPANTTYSENTGVLATTKNYDPRLLRLTAVFAIILAFFGKFGAVLQTIPGPVKGGVEIILFGMIAAVGIRTLAESKLDFTHSRNLLIVGTILALGIGFSALGGVKLTFGTFSFNLSGLFIATVVGILLNCILPRSLDKPVQPQEKTNAFSEEFVGDAIIESESETAVSTIGAADGTETCQNRETTVSENNPATDGAAVGKEIEGAASRRKIKTSKSGDNQRNKE